MTVNDPIHYVSVLTSYLSPGLKTKNNDAVRAELKAFLPGAPRDKRIMQSLLLLGDVALIEPYLVAHGTEALRDLTDIDEDPISPWRRVDFEQIEPPHRIALFDLLFDAIGVDGRDLLTHVARPAAISGDVAFLEHLLDRLNPDQDEVQSFLLYKLTLERAHPDVAPVFAKLVELIAGEDGLPDGFMQQATKKYAMRVTTILMKLGAMPRQVIEECGTRDPLSPYGRLLKRINSSNHAELDLYAKLPSIEDILRMTSDEAKLWLAGPSEVETRREAKRRLKDERIARTRAHFAAKGEPSPI